MRRQNANEGVPDERVRYRLAVSLDGFIAGPKGEYDSATRSIMAPQHRRRSRLAQSKRIATKEIA